MAPRASIVRKVLFSGALLTGASFGAAGIAAAATGGGGSTSSSTGSSTPASGATNPATMTHGPGETLLTGAALAKADSAAKAAVPGATIVRAETDSSGAAPYEVHMKKADGTYVTVELNSSYQVIKTVSGFGPGPAGSGSGPGASGAPPGPSSTSNGSRVAA